MMLAHTRLLVPKTLPNNLEAVSSSPSVVMPEIKTVKYRYQEAVACTVLEDALSSACTQGLYLRKSAIAPHFPFAYNWRILYPTSWVRVTILTASLISEEPL